MPTSESQLDFERLLAPISPDQPCGSTLRYEPVWDELSQLRKSGKDLIDSSGDKEPDWDELIVLSTTLLSTRSKDLLIAGWLTEALVNTSGFAGLRDGLRVIHGLCERFWDDLYPLPDELDYSSRVDPLIWLTQNDGGARMPALVRRIPLLPLSATPEGPTFDWNYWHLRRTPPRRTLRNGEPEPEDDYRRRKELAEKCQQTFDAAVDAAPISYFKQQLEVIDSCLSLMEQLATTLDSYFNQLVQSGIDPNQVRELAPNWTYLRDSINEIRTFIYGALKQRGGLQETSVEAAKTSQQQEQTVIENSNSQGMRHGPITSRSDAITRMEEVATFFSLTEPHSPVSYLVRRAIRWAGMPLESILGELIKDETLVKQISETLGMNSNPAN